MSYVWHMNRVYKLIFAPVYLQQTMDIPYIFFPEQAVSEVF